MQDADGAAGDGRGVAAGLDAVAAGLVAVQRDARVVEEAGEDARSRWSPPPTQAATASGRPSGELEHLGSRASTPMTLVELAHHLGERGRAGDRADEVVGVSTLVTQSRMASFMASLSVRLPASDRDDLGAEQLHAGDVEGLAAGVLLAHVDDALEAEERGRRGGRDAVLAGARLGDDARLAHAHGEQRLAEDVVDLVRAGVVEVLALEQDPRAAGVRAEPRRSR